MKMKLRSFLTLASTALVFSLFAVSAFAEEQKTLYFSAIPDQNTTELKEKFQPVAEYLASKLGVPVEYVPARDYQASVEMFRNGDVQLAWFGGLTGVQARKAVSGARAIAQGEEDPKYYSYFIANKDTGLSASEDFPEKIGEYKFTFGSESSTSGRLMPEFFIRQNTGKPPAEFFKEPVGFSGSHDKTAELVESGQYQVGVLSYTVFEKRIQNGSTNPDAVKVIWKTPFYADYNWTAHPMLEETYGKGFIEKVQAALLSIDDPKLLEVLTRKKLITAKNEDFSGIEETAKALNMIR
jgi:phosphonate transport system substrate-binding protein